jgi:hypothetical protein
MAGKRHGSFVARVNRLPLDPQRTTERLERQPGCRGPQTVQDW